MTVQYLAPTTSRLITVFQCPIAIIKNKIETEGIWYVSLGSDLWLWTYWLLLRQLWVE